MTALTYLIPILLVALAIAWIATSNLRGPRSLEELLARIQPKFARRLVPFVEPQCFKSDSNLDEAIGGWRGFVRMHRDAGTIASIVHLLANGKMKETPELEEILLGTIYIRFATPFCLIEAMFHALLKWANGMAKTNLTLPHVCSWGYARLYCDMVSGLTAAMASSDDSRIYLQTPKGQMA